MPRQIDSECVLGCQCESSAEAASEKKIVEPLLTIQEVFDFISSKKGRWCWDQNALCFQNVNCREKLTSWPILVFHEIGTASKFPTIQTKTEVGFPHE
jgi:hypothetical protein